MARNAILNITQEHSKNTWIERKLNFKYNISHKPQEEEKIIGFHSKKNMIDYLDKNKNYLNTLNHVYLNFKTIKLPLSQSSWRISKCKK